MDPTHLLTEKDLWFMFYGAMGSLIGCAVKERRIALPVVYVEKDNSGHVRRYIDPGFIANCLVGAILAAWVDGRPFTAMVYGIATAWMGQNVLQGLAELVLKGQGISLSFGQPPAKAGTPQTPTVG